MNCKDIEVRRVDFHTNIRLDDIFKVELAIIGKPHPRNCKDIGSKTNKRYKIRLVDFHRFMHMETSLGDFQSRLYTFEGYIDKIEGY